MYKRLSNDSPGRKHERECLLHFQVGKDFLNKKQCNKLNFIKNKNFFSANENIKR